MRRFILTIWFIVVILLGSGLGIHQAGQAKPQQCKLGDGCHGQDGDPFGTQIRARCFEDAQCTCSGEGQWIPGFCRVNTFCGCSGGVATMAFECKASQMMCDMANQAASPCQGVCSCS